MDSILIIVFVVLILVLVLLVWIGVTMRRGTSSGGTGPHENDSALLLQRENEALRTELRESLNAQTTHMNEQMKLLSGQVSEQLRVVTGSVEASTNRMNESLNERMESTARVVGEVRQGLGTLSGAASRIDEVGRDIASLQDIFRAPKLRGALGEYLLGDLLAQILPKKNFKLQYTFTGGARVDAAVRLSGGIVPIDSKFPMENFRRIIEAAETSNGEAAAHRKRFISDVKKHIDAIAASYILPDEGTLNFALMYIPAENVYYEAVIKDEASDGIAAYAFAKRVVPVSPNTFYAYLQTILMGLKGMEVSRRASEILASIERLSGDFEQINEEFSILGTHMQNARGRYDSMEGRLRQFTERLTSLETTRETPEDSENESENEEVPKDPEKTLSK